MAASYNRSYSSTDQVGEEGDNVKGSSLPYQSLNLAEPHLHEGTTLKRYQSSGSGCCHVEERAALRMVTAWMVIVAIAVFVALVVEIITQEHVIEVGDIVSDHVNCSKIGAEILGLGGNAVDAAVAAGICLAVAVPHEASLAGGGVMLIYQHRKNKTVVIDFLETSSSSLNVSSYSSYSSLPPHGAASVGVPGLVAGLALAWEKYGSHHVTTDCCNWLDLVWPTYTLLQEGFQVTDNFNQAVKSLKNSTNKELRQFVDERGYSMDGAFNANMSAVIKQIAHDRTSFYKSQPDDLVKIGQALVSDLDGHITEEDLLKYRAETRTPLSELIQDRYKVMTTPAPTAGPELLALLNTMEDTASDCGETHNSEDYLSSLREALEKIGGYQALLGDPKFDDGDIPIANTTLYMMNKANKKQWLSKVNKEGPEPDSRPMESGTHVAAMDRKDNYVSMVLSLGSAFGSQTFSQGILLNNAIARFSPPEPRGEGDKTANTLEPGKRPLSSAGPVIAIDIMDLCGNRIVTGGIQAAATAQVLGPVLLCAAGDLGNSQLGARLVLDGNSTATDKFMKQEIREKLEETEAIEVLPPPYSSVNALEKVQDNILGFSDNLRSGVNGYISLRPTLIQADNVDYTLYG